MKAKTREEVLDRRNCVVVTVKMLEGMQTEVCGEVDGGVEWHPLPRVRPSTRGN